MDTRKLIAHGPSSLTIALPHRWVKKHHLGKGETVSISEDELGLRISAHPSEQKRTIAVSLKGRDYPAILTILTTIYRRGYDEVETRYETTQECEHITTSVRMLLGYAVVEHRRGRCIIKSLPNEMEPFETLFRRTFQILLQQLEDLKGALRDVEALRGFYHRDADLNAIVNLALRMINKGYVADRYEELHRFHALLMIEECGDDIVRFTIEASSAKEGAKLVPYVEQTERLVRLLYDSLFKSKGSVDDFYKQYYLYWPDFSKKKDAPVYTRFAQAKLPVFYLRSIVEKAIALAEILLLPDEEQTTLK